MTPNLNALHVQLQGLTSFFRHPLTVTGVQITLPCPPYSTILGLVSACAGRIVTPNEIRIGYEYACNSINTELERTDRLVVDDKGLLRKHRKGQGIIKRYIHFLPKIDLYIDNIDLEEIFKKPAATPTLGRSQDLLWITKVEQVILEQRDSGLLGPTLLPYHDLELPSLLVRCSEWMENNQYGYTRVSGPINIFHALSPTERKRYLVKYDNLYHPSNFDNNENVIYLHQWANKK
jgi:CRISPR-associated protein Cas5t